MRSYTPIACSLFVIALTGVRANGATEKEIDAAIAKGSIYLKDYYKDARAGNSTHGIGPAALAGIALLEAKVPATDPSIRSIAAAVRDNAYREGQTYQLSLSLLFLDQLEDPADVPLIQALAVRILAGQTATGGWGYVCIGPVSQTDEQRLRTTLHSNQLASVGGKPNPPAAGAPKAGTAGKLHPEVEKYAASLWANRDDRMGDDNSNTQFAILAVWAARKRGVPVEPALDLIEKRFQATQSPEGGWSYSSGIMANGAGTPAMTCAGLIGLSVGLGRRQEHRLKAEQAKAEKETLPKASKSEDPFFNPPPKAETPAGKKPGGQRRSVDVRDAFIQRGFAALADMIARGGQRGPGSANRELYFLWSLERVGVIYGVDKIGEFDWYAEGAEIIVRSQNPDGAWAGSYGGDVSTSFALLFLTKANVARDLSSKIKKDPGNTELRAGNSTGPAVAEPITSKLPKSSGTAVLPPLVGAPTPVPGTTFTSPKPPVEDKDDAGKLAAQLVAVPAAEWSSALAAVKDAKGGGNTQALALAIHRLDGDKKKQARDALAERLTRMTAETLRPLSKADDPEMRRAAVLACAMRDDKAHVPDLIDRITDDEELVVRAARAGLKSLTGQDFGPNGGATKVERKAAAEAWKAWWSKQK